LRGTNSNVKVWENFELNNMHDLLEKNHKILMDFIENCDFEKSINYTNSKGDSFSNSVKDILTQLSHHAAHHRGQVIILMKPFVKKLPQTDYIFYVRRNQ
jgi:uncharacterized damage-inducible protein DinB